MLYNNSPKIIPWSSLQPGYYLVSRPKMMGLITHYGILEVIHQYGQMSFVVLELGPEGYRPRSIDEFRDGEQVTILDQKQPFAMFELRRRYAEHVEKYPIFKWATNNCEHFVTYLWTGKRESRQVAGLATAAGVLTFGGSVAWALGAGVAVRQLKK